MSDGVDGLAGTLSLVSLALFTGFALYAGDVAQAERLLALCAALLGFLLWNLRFPWQPRARVFLGNGGSMLLGFVIAWTSVRLTQNAAHPISPVLGPWTLALPLIDCVTLMFRRWRQGRSPFSSDRHHMHHMLLDAGFSAPAVVAVLGAVSLGLGLAAAIALKLGMYRPWLVLVFLVLLVGWYAFSSDYPRAVARLRRFAPRGKVSAAARVQSD
jgi:UDP-GlcNAc:undecaprenyl-phosphate/decaprenyl-phosphate GlcNAc-1-phosphate transferase